MSMNGFVKAYNPPAPRTKESGYAAILYAALLTGMVAAQLFTFEEFLVLFQGMFARIGEPFGMLLATGIVIAEVFALPFLLRIPLSTAFRWVSLTLSVFVSVAWLGVSLWGVVIKPSVESAGLIGTLDPLGPGLWAVSLSIALCMLAAWSLWGLWPLHTKK